MKTKVLSLILAALTFSLAACSGGDVGAAADSGASAEAPATEEVTLFKKDSLPELNYNGREVKLSLQDYGGYTQVEFFLDAEDGDVVNDAVFRRNRAVAERLNVQLTWKPVTHAWADRDVYLTAIRSSVLAGGGDFDIMAGLGYFIPGFVPEGILQNMSELPYIDIEQPWWAENFMRSTTVNGRYYCVTGDAALGMIKYMYCYFMNLKLFDSLGIKEDPYKLVDDGKWTLDKVESLAKDVYSDLNGDGAVDETDRFGLVSIGNNHITGYIEPFDVNIVELSNGKDAKFVFGNAHNVSVVERLCSFYWETPGVFYTSIHDELADDSIFKNGECLFATGWFTHTEAFRDLEFNYGALPYPKWNEAQEEYKTTVLTTYSTFALPVTCPDTELAAAFLEAFASESYRSVTPVYFETALKVKYVGDSDSARMFDLIRAGVDFDFGYVYTLAMGGVSDRLKDAVCGNDPNWASKAAGFEAQSTASLEKLMAEINKLKK